MLSSLFTPSAPAPLPKELTDEQVEKGVQARDAARGAVLQEIAASKPYIVLLKSNRLTDEEIKPYTKFLQDEIAWWNANPELSVRQVGSRSRKYAEALQLLKQNHQELIVQHLSDDPNASIDDKKKQVDSISDDKTKEELKKKLAEEERLKREEEAQEERLKKEKEAEALKALENRTWWDDVKDAFAYALGFILLVVYLVLAIRFAGFAANDLLYKPLPYRALSFAYTFLLAPLFAPYYIYREVMNWLYPSDDYKPHFESIFPVVPYDPSEPLTFAMRLYGYADTSSMRAWILKKQTEEKNSWIEKLKSTVMADLIEQREKELNPS
jgi:hypothetical protein